MAALIRPPARYIAGEIRHPLYKAGDGHPPAPNKDAVFLQRARMAMIAVHAALPTRQVRIVHCSPLRGVMPKQCHYCQYSPTRHTRKNKHTPTMTPPSRGPRSWYLEALAFLLSTAPIIKSMASRLARSMLTAVVRTHTRHHEHPPTNPLEQSKDSSRNSSPGTVAMIGVGMSLLRRGGTAAARPPSAPASDSPSAPPLASSA